MPLFLEIKLLIIHFFNLTFKLLLLTCMVNIGTKDENETKLKSMDQIEDYRKMTSAHNQILVDIN